MKTIKELRLAAGLSRSAFCDYFKLPYRTLQSWELGDREAPEYLIELIEYKLKKENIIEE